MSTPLISIIIPTYNRACILPQALNSVMAQTYEHWECIVVDDGSTDDTLTVLEVYNKKDKRIKYFKRQRKPKGAPTCRNIGLEQAQGDYVIYLDSDDYLMPFCLEQRLKAFHQNSDNDFLVFPMGEQKDKNIVIKKIPVCNDYLIPFLSANLPWSIMCPIWKKSILIELNGFTEGYPRFNDPELIIRALLQDGVKFMVFNDLDYDTVFLPSQKDNLVLLDKIFKSLTLFIPDITRKLEEANKLDYKKYLAYFLHFWFKYSFKRLGTIKLKPSMKLIELFYRHGVLTLLKALNLILRLQIFSLSKYFLRHPVNKLTDKVIYKL